MLFSQRLRRLILDLKTGKVRKGLHNYDQLVKSLGGPILEYTQRINPKRREIHDRIGTLLTDRSPELLEANLLYFAGIGAHMTRRVPQWFRSAALRISESGFTELGNELFEHSKEEDGHSLWFESDLKYLLSRYDARHGTQTDWREVLKDCRESCVEQYENLQDGVIEGSQPFAWVALKYEIERLALSEGPRLLGKCVEVIGFEILKGLSFVEQHSAADIDHAKDDIYQLHRFLSTHPHTLPSLVQCAEQALESYAQFFEKSHDRARALIEEGRMFSNQPKQAA